MLKATAIATLALLILRYSVSIAENVGLSISSFRVILPVFVPKALNADIADFLFYFALLICTSKYLFTRQYKTILKLCCYVPLHICSVALLFMCQNETLLISVFLIKAIILTNALFSDLEYEKAPLIFAAVLALSFEWLSAVGCFVYCISF